MELKLKNIFSQTTGRLLSVFQKRASLLLLVLILACALAAGAVFYLYVIKTPQITSEQQIIKINQALYQDVINRLDSRNANIQQGIGQNYRDVFR